MLSRPLLAGAAEMLNSKTSSSSSNAMFHQMLGPWQFDDEIHNQHDIHTQQYQHLKFTSSSINRSIGIDSHTMVGPHCFHCGKMYSNASNLKQHIRNVHCFVDKSMWHECRTCGKKLKTKHYLINHQLQAHGIHQRV